MAISRKKRIENVVSDLVVKLFYYDRKEDENLPVGAIEEAMAAGEITKEEIVAIFAKGVSHEG